MKENKALIFVASISVLLNILLFILLFFIARENEVGEQHIDQDEVAIAVQGTVAAMESDPASVVVADVGSGEVESEQTELPEPSPTAEPTLTPTAVPTVAPTLEPTLMPTQEPTSTPEPTATATPVPSATPAVLQGAPWLQYLNMFRLQAGLPIVTEDRGWSEGSRLHSVYMSNTGQVSHQEDVNSPYYTRPGQTAAENGNLATTFITVPGYDWAFNYWLSAPFHALPILDPQLETVGFGINRDADALTEVAATLDVKQGLAAGVPDGIDYPILFPEDGGEAWVLRYSLPEFPDGRVSCGYGSETGAPILVQIGSGDQTPNVTSSVIRQGEQLIDHCVFDESTYVNPNAYRQQVGRNILDQRDAVVLLPSSPLEIGKRYSVEVVVNGEQISWSFDAVSQPEIP